MNTLSCTALQPYLLPDANVVFEEGKIPRVAIQNPSPTLEANSYYFGHPEWAKNYFEACHRDDEFKARWRAAMGSWDDKIVVDIGCGPGNLLSSLGGHPQLIIGVDVTEGGLEMAREVGYTPLLADAHSLPLISGFADIVTLNATLHHCDDMATVLEEAARLVRPGGLLISDHDPQQTAWDFKGIGLLIWNLRLPFYRFVKRGGHSTAEEQKWGLATEIHHRAGDGMTHELYRTVLEPLGFSVNLYPHNHTVGAEVLQGNYGRAVGKYRLGQQLSGMNPNSPEAALTMMCVAQRQN